MRVTLSIAAMWSASTAWRRPNPQASKAVPSMRGCAWNSENAQPQAAVFAATRPANSQPMRLRVETRADLSSVEVVMHKPRSVRRGRGPAANGRDIRRPDAMSGRRMTPMRPPPHGRRSASVTQAAFTVPRPPPGPGQERPDAGRSPGLRVVARCTPSQALRPSGCPRGEGLCVSLAAYSCRDSRGIGRRTVRTAFPIKPFRAPTRSRETAGSRIPRDRYSALSAMPTGARTG